MASITHSEDFVPKRFRLALPAQHAAGEFVRLYRRLTSAFEARRERELERDNARLLARSGMRLTDSIEREMMERVLASSGWRTPQ